MKSLRITVAALLFSSSALLLLDTAAAHQSAAYCVVIDPGAFKGLYKIYRYGEIKELHSARDEASRCVLHPGKYSITVADAGPLLFELCATGEVETEDTHGLVVRDRRIGFKTAPVVIQRGKVEPEAMIGVNLAPANKKQEVLVHLVPNCPQGMAGSSALAAYRVTVADAVGPWFDLEEDGDVTVRDESKVSASDHHNEITLKPCTITITPSTGVQCRVHRGTTLLSEGSSTPVTLIPKAQGFMLQSAHDADGKQPACCFDIDDYGKPSVRRVAEFYPYTNSDPETSPCFQCQELIGTGEPVVVLGLPQ